MVSPTGRRGRGGPSSPVSCAGTGEAEGTKAELKDEAAPARAGEALEAGLSVVRAEELNDEAGKSSRLG